MYPIAFHIGNFAVHWYGIFIGIGFLASFGLLMYLKQYAKLTSDQIYNIAMIALFAGVIGARIFYVVQFWEQFSGRGILAILNVHEGGLVFYGGFILAFTAECFYAKWPTVRRLLGLKEKKPADGSEPRRDISILALLDILGPAMALAHAFGRVSCFMQGCCFGTAGWQAVRDMAASRRLTAARLKSGLWDVRIIDRGESFCSRNKYGRRQPSSTSRTIISAKPMAKPTVPMLE